MLEKSFELPDENVITIAAERYRCAEPLFQPRMGHMDCERNLPQSILDVVNLYDTELRHELLHNICLGGGSTKFPGLQDRLTKELTQLLPAVLVGEKGGLLCIFGDIHRATCRRRDS